MRKPPYSSKKQLDEPQNQIITHSIINNPPAEGDQEGL